MEPADSTPKPGPDLLPSSASETGQASPTRRDGVEGLGGEWVLLLTGLSGGAGGSAHKRMIDGHWYTTTDGGRTYKRDED